MSTKGTKKTTEPVTTPSATITMPKTKKTATVAVAAPVVATPAVATEAADKPRNKKNMKYDNACKVLLDLLAANNIKVPNSFYRELPRDSMFSRSKKNKPEGYPTKSRTAYTFFGDDQYANCGDKKPNFTQIAEMWKKLSEEQKAPYKKRQE